MPNPSICVAGGGSWGTALAHLLASNGYDTCLWLRDAAVAEIVNTRHENPRYLPDFALHTSLSASTAPSAWATVGGRPPLFPVEPRAAGGRPCRSS